MSQQKDLSPERDLGQTSPNDTPYRNPYVHPFGSQEYRSQHRHHDAPHQDAHRHDHHDADYDRWRTEHLRALDEDYHGWRQERYEAFSKDFHQWRSERMRAAGAGGRTSVTSGDLSDDTKDGGPRK